MAESLPFLGRVKWGKRLLLGTGPHALLSPRAASVPSSGVLVCSEGMSSLEVSVGEEMSPLTAQLPGFACSRKYLEPWETANYPKKNLPHAGLLCLALF